MSGQSFYIRHISDPVQHQTGFINRDSAVKAAHGKAQEQLHRWLVCQGKQTVAVVWPDGGVDFQPAGTPLPEQLVL